MKNRMLLVFLAVVVTVSLVLCSCAAPAPAPAPKPAPAPAPEPVEPIHLIYTSGYPPPPYFQTALDAEMMDEITERSGGRITFERYFGGALCSVKETDEAVTDGVADLGMTQWAAHPAKYPLWSIERQFPFSSSDTGVVTNAIWTLWNEFPEFEQMAAARNQKMFMFYAFFTYHLLSVKPVLTLADFKGLKTATWGIYMPQYIEPLGAVGVPLPGPDRYLSLKQGIIDSSLYTPHSDVTYKLYEVAKNYLLIGTGATLGGVNGFNLDSWNKIPPDLQKLMFEIAQRYSKVEFVTRSTKLTEECLATLKEKGVVVNELSPEEKIEWINMLPDMPAKWAADMEAKGYPGWAMAHRYIELCEEQGWEWPREWAVKK